MTRPVAFTPAQERIAMLLADGLSAPKIALRVGCSFHTVRAHIRIMALLVPGDAPSMERVRLYVLQRSPRQN